MKLLIATPLYPPEIGGPATYAKTLEGALPLHGVDVAVLPFSTVRKFPKGIAHVVYFFKLFRAARTADIVFALDPVSVGLPAALAALFRRKPFVVKIVGDYAWEQGKQRFGVKELLDEFVRTPAVKFAVPVRMLRRIQSFVARRAAVVIVPSHYLEGIIAAWGIAGARIHVIYNAFNTPHTLSSKKVLREKFKLSGKVIVSSGRLVSWKGFAMLVTIMPEVLRFNPDAKLFIAGSGPLKESLSQMIVERALSESVIMLGNVPHEELLERIRAADCFVLNTGYEGLSHQLLEVMAIGTPIVTTPAGGNIELIEDGKTGYLVGFNDALALTEAIRHVLAGEGEEFATQAVEFVAQFTKGRMIGETATLVNGIREARKVVQ